jgi:pyrroloquinoline-quinone synthase
VSGDLEARLRRVLAERYHDKHPFNVRMHEGELSREEIQTWVCNRYYYQTRIPLKDSVILTKSGDPAFRREWVQRIHDHDGVAPGEGGLARWLDLAEVVGLERAEVESLAGVLPGVRAACDDYVRLVEERDLLEAVASSLTEMAAGEIMKVRLAAFEKHYPWVGERGLAYFRSRVEQAPRDATWGLAWVLENARTPEEADRCVAALEKKCEILWRLLDAVEHAHRVPRLAPAAQRRRDPRDGRATVVLPERAVRLNESGEEILDLCDGSRSADAIARELAERHPEIHGVVADVHAFLAEMERLGVLVAAPPASAASGAADAAS